MTPAWHSLRADIIAAGGHDAWIDLLETELANARIARARMHTLMRGDLEYTGTNARELQAELSKRMGANA